MKSFHGMHRRASLNRIIPRENGDVRLWVSKNAEGASLREAPPSRLLILLFLCYTGAYMNGGRVAS